MRALAAALLLLTGLAYLAYKVAYLAMDAPDTLKAFIVAPGAALLTLAALVAFPDARRRLGGALLALGLVALLWIALEPPPNGGWTFYTPYASMDTERPPWLKGPNALLTAAATLLPFLGLSIFLRRSVLGGLLLGGSLWFSLCFVPSRLLSSDDGMPQRDRYYYFSGERPLAWDHGATALPILLGLAGATLTMRKPKEAQGG